MSGVSRTSVRDTLERKDLPREPQGLSGGHSTSGKAFGSTEMRGFEMTVRTSTTESRSSSAGVHVRRKPDGESR